MASPELQHEIQNTILSWRGIRKHMYASIIAVAKDMNEVDKQMVRLEKVLRGETVPEKGGKWVRLKKSLTNPFDVFLR